MSAEQEDIIIDRVSDMDDAEDQLLAEEKVDKEATEEVAEVEEDFPTQGRYFTSQKQLDATQLYLNEIGFSPCLRRKKRSILPVWHARERSPAANG